MSSELFDCEFGRASGGLRRYTQIDFMSVVFDVQMLHINGEQAKKKLRRMEVLSALHAKGFQYDVRTNIYYHEETGLRLQLDDLMEWKNLFQYIDKEIERIKKDMEGCQSGNGSVC